MKQSLLILSLIFSLNVFGQNSSDNKTVKYFENCIRTETVPNDCLNYQYKGEYRLIVWNDPLIKSFKYSDEVFAKLGYDYLPSAAYGDRRQQTSTYRNCSKSIIVEVTEWYNLKFSISMKWYGPNTRTGIGYLRFCH